MVFFSSDGTAVNSSLKAGVISKFKVEMPWVTFVWCISHRLELALKDALKKSIDPVDTCIRNLYYLYEKSSKKLRELKSLFGILNEMYEFSNNRVKPNRAAGTRWIDHKVRAIEGMIDKYGVYMKHIENILVDAKQTDKATLQGKRNMLLEAKTILYAVFFLDALEPAKVFSLKSQEKDVNILKITDMLEDTKSR
jgi:hypothetical protein